MSPRRKELFREGKRGHNLVRVVEGTQRGALVYWVLYRIGPQKKETSFPRTRAGKHEALAFARGVRDVPPAPAPTAPKLTVEQLFAQFLEENVHALRANSVRIYKETWSHWQNFVGPHTVAQDCSRDNMVKLRTYLELDRSRTLATSSISRVMVTVRHVYRWAEDAGLIPPSTVLRYIYRVAKDKRTKPRAEFRIDEFLAIAMHCGLDTARWRPGAVIRLCGYQGKRQWQVLHLRWEDVRWDQEELTWQALWDKNGVEDAQPMRRPTRAVLEFLRARAGNPTEGWVFPAAQRGAQGQVYTAQALWLALRKAQRACGIPILAGRGAHGFRKLLAGEVAELTGNIKLAMDAIGDKDISMAERYVVKRQDKLRDAFTRLDDQLESRTKDVQGETSGMEAAR